MKNAECRIRLDSKPGYEIRFRFIGRNVLLESGKELLANEIRFFFRFKFNF
jgi:hypothetical protein